MSCMVCRVSRGFSAFRRLHATRVPLFTVCLHVIPGWLCARSNHEIEQQADNEYTIFAAYQARLKVSSISTSCSCSTCATARAHTRVVARAL
jgi:hypothetical protein